jgi:hypothetical protein
MLLVMKLFTTLMHALILQTRPIIIQKALYARLQLEEGRITGDMSTKLTRFFNDG